MSALAARRSAFALGPVLALSACELFRPADSIEAHPDVTTITIVLEAGKSEARILAVHPHRPQGAEAPRITAVLEGPGWTATFSAQPDPESCAYEMPVSNWPGPARCYAAALPEAVRASRSYGIRGTAPLGSFTGDMTMPAPPVIEDPADDVQLTAGGDEWSVPIPLEYRKGPDIGTLMAHADYWEIQEDGTEVGLSGAYPQLLDGDAADTVHHIHGGPLAHRLELRLFGIGWHYTNFVAEFSEFPLPQPWPDFGIEGEGVYGYFDGLTPSSDTVEIRVVRTGSRRSLGTIPPDDRH
ncbi:MAG: hypothetical protein OXU32_06265 [Gammaproteobacteria bacterium]|nr:hypothetical protein [Gammaproteobacteria bacterium]